MYSSSLCCLRPYTVDTTPRPFYQIGRLDDQRAYAFMKQENYTNNAIPEMNLLPDVYIVFAVELKLK